MPGKWQGNLDFFKVRELSGKNVSEKNEILQKYPGNVAKFYISC